MSIPSFPITRAPHVLSRQVRELVILLDFNTKEYISFDEVGSSMWQALLSANSLSEALDQLLDEYEVTQDMLEHDLQDFLALCEGRGLIQTSP